MNDLVIINDNIGVKAGRTERPDDNIHVSMGAIPITPTMARVQAIREMSINP
jgi:hypothetical protein